MIHSLNETQRNSLQLQDAADGLESAIKVLDEIASSPHTPYPKHDIEQRANMARNTQRKQLERALASQKEYEEKNKEKLAAAMEQRQAELRRREEEKRKVEEALRERQEKIRKEREEIAARDRLLAEQRDDEERTRLESSVGEAGEKAKKRGKASSRGTGEPRQKGVRSRRKKADSEGDESGGEERPKKKQRLSRRGQAGNYKSAEIVEDSSEDDDELERAERALAREGAAGSDADDVPRDDISDTMEVDNSNVAGEDDEGEEETVSRRQQAKRSRRGRILEESDEEEEGEPEKGSDNDDVADEPAGPIAEEDEAAPADTSMADLDEDDE